MIKSIIFSLVLVNVIANVADARSYTVVSQQQQVQQIDNSVHQYQDNSYNDNSVYQSINRTNNYTTNHTTNNRKIGGNTTGTVSINKDTINNYNGSCTQHCVVYIIKEPKIQYIRN